MQRPAYVAVLLRAAEGSDAVVAEGAASALAASAAVEPLDVLESSAAAIGSWHPAALVEDLVRSLDDLNRGCNRFEKVVV